MDAQLVVELGAGTGKLTRAVAALGVRVVAVEPDPRMLAVLHGLGLEGVEGSAEAIPLGDGVADAVVAGSSLHWFELELALPEIHRVLRPGGRFGFGWNHRDDRHPAIAAHGRGDLRGASRARPAPRWRSRDWPAELTASGLFRDVEQALFEHVHELPREALRDHLMSYSGVAALPEDERRRVLSEVAGLLDSDESVSGDGTLRLPFVVTAYRATRVRPGSTGHEPACRAARYEVIRSPAASRGRPSSRRARSRDGCRAQQRSNASSSEASGDGFDVRVESDARPSASLGRDRRRRP